MNVFISMETWDIDDTLMLLFLLHYHILGKIKVIGIEVDSGTLEQNNFIGFILKKVDLKIPVFSRNLKNPKGNEIPDYYYNFFKGLKKEELFFTERSEVFDYLRNKKFKVIVGGSLNFVRELIKRSVIPQEIIVQGGFAGKNITGKTNPKFGNLKFKATFNFNKDFRATLEFLELQKGLKFPLYLVSKNVNHLITLKSEDVPNITPKTQAQKLYLEVLRKYLSEVRREKSLHDVYAALAIFDKDLFRWEEVRLVFKLGKRYPEWGAEKSKSNIFITVEGEEGRIKELASFRREFV